MIEVRVPDEQEGTKAVVRAWLRRVGDLVFETEPLVELETDKVTQEVEADASGVLLKWLLMAYRSVKTLSTIPSRQIRKWPTFGGRVYTFVPSNTVSRFTSSGRSALSAFGVETSVL